MDSIVEVPLDTLDLPEDIPKKSPTIPYKSEDIPINLEDSPAEEKTKPRAKGRPKGSKNVAPSKPRAKKIIQELVEERPKAALRADAERPYSPTSPKRNLLIPSFGVDEVAAEMLRLLTNQSQVRQQHKRNLYKSWFQ